MRAALRQDPRTAMMNIGIEAKDGRVTLSGVIDASVDEADVLEVASAVTGVPETEHRLQRATLPRYKLDS